MEFETQRGRRKDLELIPVNNPIGYIGGLVYPTLPVREKTGTVYFKTVTADAAAQTGRSSGTAPTKAMLTDSSTAFSTAEAIKRYAVDRNEVMQMGGIEAADKLGGTASKRSIQRALEDAAAASLISAAAYSAATDISSTIFAGIDDAADSVRRYAGKTAFVCSKNVYKWLIKQTELTGKMSWSFTGASIQEILSMNVNVFKAMLQGLFAFDEVLVGDDDHWMLTGMEDAAAVVKLPPPDEFSHKMDPVLGKNVIYMPDDNQFEINSFYDDDARINAYDCASWYVIKELNSGAKKLVKGLGTPTT
ncbi:MAG: hypothetical protein A2020_16410 [Lentisphaerae bacterium GWF2_45_14]|nr:MAG: hypothetical protein A2020_16410 [Lentisphaerae bacterium GWF2_45_14]